MRGMQISIAIAGIAWLSSGVAWAAPTIAISSPANGAAVYGTVSVTAATSGFGKLTKVQFYLDGKRKFTDTAGPWSWAWDTALTPTGSHALYARGYDAKTKRWAKSAAITVTVQRADTTPPTGSVVINGGAVYTTTRDVTLTVSASDPESSVMQMQFSNDNVNYSSPESYAASKSWTLSTGDGAKIVYAKFKNGQNLWSAVASDTITLDATPPAPPTVDPLPRYLTTPTAHLRGTKPADTSVWVNGAQVVMLDSLTTWSADVSLNDGPNTLAVMTRDAAGNSSAPIERSVIVLHQPLPPSP